MLFFIKFGTKLGIKLDIPKHFRENPLSNRDFSLKFCQNLQNSLK